MNHATVWILSCLGTLPSPSISFPFFWTQSYSDFSRHRHMVAGGSGKMFHEWLLIRCSPIKHSEPGHHHLHFCLHAGSHCSQNSPWSPAYSTTNILAHSFKLLHIPQISSKGWATWLNFSEPQRWVDVLVQTFYISYFSDHCDKIRERTNLRRELFVWVHSLREHWHENRGRRNMAEGILHGDENVRWGRKIYLVP